jgi:flagellar capping protein FliD
MSDNNNQTEVPMQLTITQDKLVDLLLHAATREDIARLDAKIDSKFTELDSKISNLDSKFEAKFDKIDAKFDKLNAKIDKITWLIIGAILVPILLHFIH